MERYVVVSDEAGAMVDATMLAEETAMPVEGLTWDGASMSATPRMRGEAILVRVQVVGGA